MNKEEKTAAELEAMIEYAISKIPELAVEAKLDPTLVKTLFRVKRQPLYGGGFNWNITGGQNLGHCTAQIFEVIGALRDKYDLAE